EWFPEPRGREAQVGQRPRVEAGVEQMQDGVFDPTDVLIDWHPMLDSLVAERYVWLPRVAEPQEVPGRANEGVHGVGLPLGRPPPFRARRVQETFVVLEWRLAGRAELDVVGRQDRKLVLGNGNHAVIRAVDDRDRTTPVSLSAYQPVTQPVVDLALTN